MNSNASHRFNNSLRYRDGAHPNQRQLTPPYVLRHVLADIASERWLDPCTEPDNPTGASDFFTEGTDGLSVAWPQIPAFVNPPYSRARETWVQRCINHGRNHRVILLIPAHTDTRTFHRAMMTAQTVVFIKGRVKFGVLRANRRQEAASHPSCLIGWNTSLEACSSLGLAMRAAGLPQEPTESGEQ